MLKLQTFLARFMILTLLLQAGLCFAHDPDPQEKQERMEKIDKVVENIKKIPLSEMSMKERRELLQRLKPDDSSYSIKLYYHIMNELEIYRKLYQSETQVNDPEIKEYIHQLIDLGSAEFIKKPESLVVLSLALILDPQLFNNLYEKILRSLEGDKHLILDMIDFLNREAKSGFQDLHWQELLSSFFDLVYELDTDISRNILKGQYLKSLTISLNNWHKYRVKHAKEREPYAQDIFSIIDFGETFAQFDAMIGAINVQDDKQLENLRAFKRMYFKAMIWEVQNIFKHPSHVETLLAGKTDSPLNKKLKLLPRFRLASRHLVLSLMQINREETVKILRPLIRIYNNEYLENLPPEQKLEKLSAKIKLKEILLILDIRSSPLTTGEFRSLAKRLINKYLQDISEPEMDLSLKISAAENLAGFLAVALQSVKDWNETEGQALEKKIRSFKSLLKKLKTHKSDFPVRLVLEPLSLILAQDKTISKENLLQFKTCQKYFEGD